MKRSRKAERWFDEGVQHYQAGDPQKALVTFEQAEALYRALIADNQHQHYPDLAGTLQREGDTLAKLQHPADACACYQEAASIYLETGDPQKALVVFEQAEALYRALIADNQHQHYPDLAGTLRREGDTLTKLQHPADACTCYQEAADIYQTLITEGQTEYHPILALTLMDEGVTLAALQRVAEALACFQETAKIYQTLIAAGETLHRSELARTRMNEGSALGNLQRPAEALARFQEAAEIYQTLITGGQPLHRSEADALAHFQEPAKVYQIYQTLIAAETLPELARTRMNEGVALNDLQRPVEALACFQKAVQTYKTLIADGKTQYCPDLACVHMNEGVTFVTLQRTAEALACFQETAKIYQTLIAAGETLHRSELAHTRMNEGSALNDLNRPREAIARYLNAAQIYRTLIDEGQAQYLPNLVRALTRATAACAVMGHGLEPALAAHLDLILGVWEGAETPPALTLKNVPDLANLIHRTRSAAGFAARVERLTQQIARALGGVAPENLGQFYPLAKSAFTHLLSAALDENAWDLALTVIGTARAQRLAKLAQADLLRRAAREDDPAELHKYREAMRRFAELEILLNTGAGASGEGTTSGRGGGDAGQQYQTLYNEYTTLRGELGKLEQTLRQQNLLPDLGAGLFDGAGLRQKLPPQAALLLLVQVQEPPANLVVVLTRDGGHAGVIEGWPDWTRRLDDITRTLKGEGRTLRDGPGLDTPTESAEANARAMPRESADTQAIVEPLNFHNF